MKRASGVPRAVQAVRVAAARGLGECRAVMAGVDAGGGRPSSRPDVLTAPRGARECPYKAHVRILSGSVVRGGSRVQAPHIAYVRVLTGPANAA